MWLTGRCGATFGLWLASPAGGCQGRRRCRRLVPAVMAVPPTAMAGGLAGWRCGSRELLRRSRCAPGRFVLIGLAVVGRDGTLVVLAAVLALSFIWIQLSSTTGDDGGSAPAIMFVMKSVARPPPRPRPPCRTRTAAAPVCRADQPPRWPGRPRRPPWPGRIPRSTRAATPGPPGRSGLVPRRGVLGPRNSAPPHSIAAAPRPAPSVHVLHSDESGRIPHAGRWRNRDTAATPGPAPTRRAERRRAARATPAPSPPRKHGAPLGPPCRGH